MKFKVKSGKYYPQGSKQALVKGDVVETEMALDTKFPGMFERVDEDTQTTPFAAKGGAKKFQRAAVEAPKTEDDGEGDEDGNGDEGDEGSGKKVLTAVPAKGGKWNVVDEEGNVQNDKPLSKSKALEFIADAEEG
jgi:hypothetical protein